MCKDTKRTRSKLAEHTVDELVQIILRKDEVDRNKNVMIKELRLELRQYVLANEELKKNFQTKENEYKMMVVKLDALQEKEKYYRKTYIIQRYLTGMMLGIIIILVYVYNYM